MGDRPHEKPQLSLSAEEQIEAHSSLLALCQELVDAYVKTHGRDLFRYRDDRAGLIRAIDESQPYWSTRNTFVARLLDTVRKSMNAGEWDVETACRALTSYLLFYVVRYKSPFEERARWRYSVRLVVPQFRDDQRLSVTAPPGEEGRHDAATASTLAATGASWFPWMPEKKMGPTPKDHFLAAQYTMVDASYNAVAPRPIWARER